MNIFHKLNEYWKREGAEFHRFYGVSYFSPKRIVGKFLDRRMAILRSELSDIAGKKVLDLACGSGVQMKEYVGRCAEIVGADISQDLLSIARETLHNSSGKWSLIEADAVKLPFTNKSFDVIYVLGLLDYVEKPSVVLKECRRVLRDDGQLFLTMPRRPSVFSFLRTGIGLWIRRVAFSLPPIANALKRSELELLLKDAGFSILSCQSLWTAMWLVKAQ